MSIKGIKNKQAFQSVYIAFDMNSEQIIRIIQITINILTTYGNSKNRFMPLPLRICFRILLSRFVLEFEESMKTMGKDRTPKQKSNTFI